MNKLDYTNKVTAILNKDNLFHKVHVEDPLKHTILIEDKLNRNLKSWLNQYYYQLVQTYHLHQLDSDLDGHKILLLKQVVIMKLTDKI